MKPPRTMANNFETRTFLVRSDSDDGEEETCSFKDHRGTGVPSPQLGALGDTYIDVEALVLYGHCAGGWTQWPGPANHSTTLAHPTHESLFLWCNATEKAVSWMSRSKMERSQALSASGLISQVVTTEARKKLKRKADALPKEVDSREKRPNITAVQPPVPGPGPITSEPSALAWLRCKGSNPPPKSPLSASTTADTPDMVPPDLVPLHVFPPKLLSPPVSTATSQPIPPPRGIPSTQLAPVMLNFLHATTRKEPQHFVGVQSPTTIHPLNHPTTNTAPEKAHTVSQPRLSPETPIDMTYPQGVSVQHPLPVQSPSLHPSTVSARTSTSLVTLPQYGELAALNHKLSTENGWLKGWNNKLISQHKVMGQDQDTLRKERDMLQRERDALQQEGKITKSQVRDLFQGSNLLFAKSEAQQRSIHAMEMTIQRLQADNKNLRMQVAVATAEHQNQQSTGSLEMAPQENVTTVNDSHFKKPNVPVNLEPLDNSQIEGGGNEHSEMIDLTLSDNDGPTAVPGNTLSKMLVTREKLIGSTNSAHVMPPSSSPTKGSGAYEALGGTAASVSSLPPPAQQTKWIQPSPSQLGHFLIVDTEFSDTQLIELVQQRGGVQTITTKIWGQILLHLELVAKEKHQNFEVPRLGWSDTCAALEHYYLRHIVRSQSTTRQFFTPQVVSDPNSFRSSTSEFPTDTDAAQPMLVDLGARSASSEISEVTVEISDSSAHAAALVADAPILSGTNVGTNVAPIESGAPEAAPGRSPFRSSSTENYDAVVGDHGSGDNMQQSHLGGDADDSNHEGEMEEVKNDTPEIRSRRLTQTHLEILWTNYEGVFFCDVCGSNGVKYAVGANPGTVEEMLEHSEGHHADVCDIITTKTSGMSDTEIQDWLKEFDAE
ncbi:hypothetical protein C8F04DRAFT_1395802 [Mycena alexandri]|uniref:Uncharacterized protein n=1 Tax=Mycena alexandri TaxID=1745969 RepID=A0AAD6X3S6_9AGAR|nr:hypothetical protein C8F04DRAFT_1395802 [Mycena alexandri]